MSTDNFDVYEHFSPCQFIRDYPHAVKRADAELVLAVKEYRPRNANPSSDAVTIIASPGNGFGKECYEALWDELLETAKAYEVGSIWVADSANQGASYAKNVDLLGDDISWFDHSRDLLLMINTFRGKMKPPFVGIGHSMGAAHIANLALMHPRLFHSVIFLDPVISDEHPPGPNAALLASTRREEWASREKAEASFKRNPLFQTFDARVVEAFLRYGLKQTDNGSIILTTPKAQEAWSYVRSQFHAIPDPGSHTLEARNRERLLNPEFLPFEHADTFARGDLAFIMGMLPHLRPRALYVFGERSHINRKEERQKLLERTGIGRSGNGGATDGGVEMKVLKKRSHFLCFEDPQETGKEISAWLLKEIVRWREERNFWATIDTGKSKNDRSELSTQWIEAVKMGAHVRRPQVTAKL